MASVFFKTRLCSKKVIKSQNGLTDKSVVRGECVVWTVQPIYMAIVFTESRLMVGG